MSDTIRLLLDARAAEKEQTLFYRALAAVAEARGDDVDIEALNGLLADEQHHLSRLSVRLVELGVELPRLTAETPDYDYTDWRYEARSREEAEIYRYENLLTQSIDPATTDIVRAILDVERKHAANLGGKYTEA